MMMPRRAGLTLLEVAIASILLVVIFGVAFAILMSSSDHAVASEAELQLENRAREVINQVASELRQTTWDKVYVGGGGIPNLLQVKTASGGSLIEGPSEPDPLPAPSAAARFYQYPDANRSSVAPPTGFTSGKNLTYNASFPKWMQFPYTEIQFRMLGVDNTGWTPSTFKASPDSYWTRRVHYRLDMDEGEGTYPDGVDNNKNGLVDESVLTRIEETLDAAGNPIPGKTTQSIICRDIVANGFQIYMPAWGPDANKIVLTLTLEKRDPKYAKYANQRIMKQVKISVSLRN
jgi:type II secretory pathway pseudopilin PulG